MGSPEFAVSALDALVSNPRFDVVQVGHSARPAEGTRQEARAHGGEGVRRGARDPRRDHDPARLLWTSSRELAALEPDFAVVASFGIILKKDLLELPRHGCVNVHASLLPRYRGVSPIQAAILAGDEKTGCTTMLMDEGVDTGPVLLADSGRYRPEGHGGHARTQARGARLGAPGADSRWDHRRVRPSSRAGRESRLLHAKGSKGARRDRLDEGRGSDRKADPRDVSRGPRRTRRFRGSGLIVLEAAVTPNTGGEPGVVVSSSPLVVATGEGGLELRRVKIEGKNEMTAAAFLAGYRVKPGDRLV